MRRVEESIVRINEATASLEPGWKGAVRLSPYQQQEGVTCFFSGPIAVARDFLGIQIMERPLAVKARQLDLLDQYGAITAYEDKRLALETLVKEETGVHLEFHRESWGDQQEDLEILRILVDRGNLALVLYPRSIESHEWETFFGVTKVRGEAGVRWHSNFSPTGKLIERTTPQMAALLYGKPQNPYLLICEIEIQTPLDLKPNLFGPASS